MPGYEQAELWKRAMSARPDDTHAHARERLRAAYGLFWTNAVAFAREIQKDLPALTLHDESHFEALWARADQIAGPSYVLSPLEIFVLGGAILLHDAANSAAAFPGGLSEIQGTPEWRDAVADWLAHQPNDTTGDPPASATPDILLNTLRALHAQRAEALAHFEVSVSPNRFHLLPDEQLRVHLGGLIGLIAASHHWDLADLPQRLPDRFGVLSGMPPHWFVRPVLLGCLLRCSDAAQLDQQRAPDFLFGLLQLRGVSEAHWRAQNRIATPLVDETDPAALIFTSTIPFEVSDSEAWWIAYEAIQMANRELQQANSLLRDVRLPPFAVNRVLDAETPDRISKHLIPTGWQPVAARVSVTRVDRIVDMFGGEKLYGHHMAVPLRELIQNSADAIQFRRELEPPGSMYDGNITVRLTQLKDGSEDWLLSVEDDGLGMSQAVLTGPLIDFGSSYMSSALVKAERPGLLSKGRRRIGEFGVGFFSAFMITDHVSVTSRPFDEGLDSSRTLRFDNGIVSRPLLLRELPSGFGASLSTRVDLRIAPDKILEMLTVGQTFSKGSGTQIKIEELVPLLCPMLDANIYVGANTQTTLVHERDWMSRDRVSWLRRIAHPDRWGQEAYEDQMQEAASRLAFVDPTDPSAGLACIAFNAASGVATVGTLKATPAFNEYKNEYWGAIDHDATGPQRWAREPRASQHLPRWASEQAIELAKAEIPFPARQYAAQRVARFGGDATPIAGMKLNQEWATLDAVLDYLIGGNAVFAPLKPGFGIGEENKLLITVVRENHSGWVDNYFPGDLEYLVPTLEGVDSSGDDNLYRIPTDADPAECGFCMLLTRRGRDRGHLVEGVLIERVEFARYIGEASRRENLTPGKVIGGWALQLTSRPLA